MVLSRLKNIGKKDKATITVDSVPYIIILEDDPEQMSILVEYTLDEIRKTTTLPSINDIKKKKAQTIKIIKATNIESLKKAVSVDGEIILAVLDCNIPDTKDSSPNDQFVKENRVINGRHQSVDIVTEYSPSTKITIISMLNRFQKIVHNYYKKEHDLSINFISKKDPEMIKRNISWTIRRYLNKTPV